MSPVPEARCEQRRSSSSSKGHAPVALRCTHGKGPLMHLAFSLHSRGFFPSPHAPTIAMPQRAVAATRNKNHIYELLAQSKSPKVQSRTCPCRPLPTPPPPAPMSPLDQRTLPVLQNTRAEQNNKVVVATDVVSQKDGSNLLPPPGCSPFRRLAGAHLIGVHGVDVLTVITLRICGTRGLLAHAGGLHREHGKTRQRERSSSAAHVRYDALCPSASAAAASVCVCCRGLRGLTKSVPTDWLAQMCAGRKQPDPSARATTTNTHEHRHNTHKRTHTHTSTHRHMDGHTHTARRHMYRHARQTWQHRAHTALAALVASGLKQRSDCWRELACPASDPPACTPSRACRQPICRPTGLAQPPVHMGVRSSTDTQPPLNPAACAEAAPSMRAVGTRAGNSQTAQHTRGQRGSAGCRAPRQAE